MDLFEALGTLSLWGEPAETLEWRKWIEETPYISWPAKWQVKAIPPFNGAIVRYLVRREDTPVNKRVSIYLDCYDILGYVGEPYWEVYPGDEGGNPSRCNMEETDALIELTHEGLLFLATQV